VGFSGCVVGVCGIDADRDRGPIPLARPARVELCPPRECDRCGCGPPDIPARAEAIREAATAWARFWDGHLDLDALAWEVAEHPQDMHEADQRIERATTQASHYWAALYGDDPLLGRCLGWDR